MEGDCNVYAHSSLWMRPTRPDRYNAKMVYRHRYCVDRMLDFAPHFDECAFLTWRGNSPRIAGSNQCSWRFITSQIQIEAYIALFTLYICLSVCDLSVCMSVCVSVCVSVCLSVGRSVRPSVCLPVCLLVCCDVGLSLGGKLPSISNSPVIFPSFIISFLSYFDQIKHDTTYLKLTIHSSSLYNTVYKCIQMTSNQIKLIWQLQNISF